MMNNLFLPAIISLISSVAVASPAFAGVLCDIGERRVQENVVIADAFAEQCVFSCETNTDRQIYHAPPGWAIIRYWTGTLHDRGRTTRSYSHLTAQSHYMSEQQRESARREAGSVSGTDPNTGQTVQIGGSIAAQRIEALHDAHRTTHTTVVLSVSATGRQLREGSSQRTEGLNVEELCIGTIDDYRAALRDEIDAASSTSVTGIAIPVNFGNTLFYDRNSGVCAFTASNGRVIQRLTTCRRTWHSIVYTADKLLFYDRDAGQIETYRVDNRGLGAQLHSYAPGSMRRTWAQITSPQQGVIVFRDDNGQVETYRLNDIGMLQGL